MKRHSLIVRNPKSSLSLEGSRLVIRTPLEEQYVGLRRIERIFVNYRAHFDMKDAIALARSIPVYFIDYKGIIVAKVSFQV